MIHWLMLCCYSCFTHRRQTHLISLKHFLGLVWVGSLEWMEVDLEHHVVVLFPKVKISGESNLNILFFDMPVIFMNDQI